MKKSKRPKASRREDGVDFISSMPDDILVRILARLSSTEEVIRTSILSKRWLYLWTAVPSVDLCGKNSENRKLHKREFKNYVTWVLANKSVDLDFVRLELTFYHISISPVFWYIHVAVMKNVKELDLTFYPKEKEVEIPHCLVTCGSLEVFRLTLGQERLRLPNIKGFPALRVLDFTNVHLMEDDDLVNKFLESCLLLEDLRLLDCVLNKLMLLCISCPKLKRLSIINRGYEGFGRIKICCPKLVDLCLRGHITSNTFFEGLQSLKKALIEPKLERNTISVLFPVISRVLFPVISRVEYLSIIINLNLFNECINAASCDLALTNMKNLVLKTTMNVFTMDSFNRILKHYPKLESLELISEQYFGAKQAALDEAETMRILSSDLKRVELFKFNGEKPKLVINWSNGFLTIFFTWSNKVRFSHC